LQVVDPAERELPAGGLVRIFNPETGDSDIIDLSAPKLREKFSQQIKKEQAELAKKMKTAKVDLLALKTNEPYVNELQKFFDLRIKRRKR
jgi:hypothetical protein